MVSSAVATGARLADVLPSLIHELDVDAQSIPSGQQDAVQYSPLTAAVCVVVDGLGWSNLMQRKAHARFLMSQKRERIESVLPSTTGAALTTLLTGTLPGQHGLIGYRIRDERDGRMRCTLTDWTETDGERAWLRAPSIFVAAQERGLRPIAIGRSAHAQSGFTRAVLAGAEYCSANTIGERFKVASESLRSNRSRLIYLYVDELDRAGHLHGWQSRQWADQLEEFDSQLERFAKELPVGVGCVVTADHGMVDVPVHKHILMDELAGLLDGVAQIGGEPRLRYLYLEQPTQGNVERLRSLWQRTEGKRARIYTREDILAGGVFGPIDEAIAGRLGDIVVAATSAVAYYTSRSEDLQGRSMVGQHGSATEDETGIPLFRIGAARHS